MPFRPLKQKQYITLFIVLALAVLAATALFFYMQNRRLTAANREVEHLVKVVGKIFELPAETPTVATVVDKEKLTDQTFFAKAENEDKVLIFTEAKRAILYRPATNKIIEVAPFIAPPVTDATQVETSPGPKVNSAPSTTVPTAGQTATAAATVTILNGTSTTGLAKDIVPIVQDTLPGTTIGGTLQAKSTGYEKTLVIDVKKTKAAQAEQLAKALGATVAPLPPGEDTPTTDLLVIVGKDKE